VRGVAARATWAPVHERDVADVGVRALLDDDLIGTRPVLTGPRSLTQVEMVTAIGAALGRDLGFQEIPTDVALQAMQRLGLPADFAASVLTMTASPSVRKGS
jgi:uncharacterized protein YbjT (DUF2867 family)